MFTVKRTLSGVWVWGKCGSLTPWRDQKGHREQCLQVWCGVGVGKVWGLDAAAGEGEGHSEECLQEGCGVGVGKVWGLGAVVGLGGAQQKSTLPLSQSPAQDNSPAPLATSTGPTFPRPPHIP